MTVLISIYLLGYLLCFLVTNVHHYKTLPQGGGLMVGDILFTTLLSLGSWLTLGIFLCVCVINWDFMNKRVWTKR